MSIKTKNFLFRLVYFINCNYAYNINLIFINGEIGTIRCLMISNVTNATSK